MKTVFKMVSKKDILDEVYNLMSKSVNLLITFGKPQNKTTAYRHIGLVIG